MAKQQKKKTKNKNKNNNNNKQVYSVDPEEMIFRDHLAADRTALANERTYLSYIRTAIAFVAAGFGLIKFTTETSFIVIGWILVPIGIGFLAFGTYRFFKFRKITHDIKVDYNYNVDRKISIELQLHQ